MHVDITHHVDASEPDDADGYYYAYTLYRFSDGHNQLVARSYDDEADQAHFLSITVGRTRADDDRCGSAASPAAGCRGVPGRGRQA